MEQNRSQIFISYSRKDAEWLRRLRVHLKPLENQHGIGAWADTDIEPGSKWEEKTRTAIETARVAILLISADFLASEFIAKHELPPLLHAAKTRGTRLLPIIISPSLFSETPGLNEYQAVNDPSRPLIELSLAAQEAVFVKVTQLVRQSLTRSPEPMSASADRRADEHSADEAERSEKTIEPKSFLRSPRTLIIAALIVALSAVAIIGNKLARPFIIPGPEHKNEETAETAELSGAVVDGNEQPLQGARVTLDDFPGMSAVETSSNGVFNLKDIPRKYGEGVRVRVIMEGYEPYPCTEDVVLGKTPPIIKLTRKK